MSEKKSVTYDKSKGVLQHPQGGVILWPIDHPDTQNVSNASWSLTSKVQKFHEGDVIETENTIYRPNE